MLNRAPTEMLLGAYILLPSYDGQGENLWMELGWWLNFFSWVGGVGGGGGTSTCTSTYTGRPMLHALALVLYFYLDETITQGST